MHKEKENDMLIKKISVLYVILLLAMTFFAMPVKKNVVYVSEYLRSVEVDNYTSNIFSVGKKVSGDKDMIEIIVIDYQKYVLYVFICALICSLIYLTTFIITSKNTSNEVV